MPEDFELSRRKALAALGTVGVTSAGAGLGTSAFFSDRESFENNQLTAGTLDLKVSWAEHYSDWSEDEAEHAHMEDGELVVDDRQGFMEATLQEQFPDKRTRRSLDQGTVEPCDVLADVPDDLSKPVIELEDVKPGDFGEVTFDLALCDNPGYLWMTGELLANAENGLTEPEADDPEEDGNGVGAQQFPGNGELADALQVTIWDDADCDNVVDQDEDLLFAGSLADAMRLLSGGVPGAPLGMPLAGDVDAEEGGGAAGTCFSASTRHCIGFAWELPVDHANELQSDRVAFDLGFYAEQCRHNDGTGLNTGLPVTPRPTGTEVHSFPNGTNRNAKDLHVQWSRGVQVVGSDPFDSDNDYGGSNRTDHWGGTVGPNGKAEVTVKWDGSRPQVEDWCWTTQGAPPAGGFPDCP